MGDKWLKKQLHNNCQEINKTKKASQESNHLHFSAQVQMYISK